MLRDYHCIFDDLVIGIKDPMAFLHTLIEKYSFKLKGSVDSE